MTPAPGTRVGVIGGGRMGAGIAHGFAAAGCAVTVIEPGTDGQRAALGRIGAILERAAKLTGNGEPAPEVLRRVRTAGSPGDLPGDCDLVVEAVPELPEIKAIVLAAAERAVGERAVGERCLIASNTSSLSITSLARGLELPARFLGMHFLNPVPASTVPDH